MANTLSNRMVYKDIEKLYNVNIYNMNQDELIEFKSALKKRMKRYPKLSEYEKDLSESIKTYNEKGGFFNKLSVSEDNLDIATLKILISRSEELLKLIDERINYLEKYKGNIFCF